MLPDIFSLQGIALVHETIEHVRTSCNPKIKIAGILINRYSNRSRLRKEIFGTVKMISDSLSIPIFKSVIHNCNSITEAQSLQCDVTEYAKKSACVKDYSNLAQELIDMGIVG
jgi:chromosome partitioning protein